MDKRIYISIGMALLMIFFIIPSWHNSFEDGRYEGYLQGSNDAMEHTKDRLIRLNYSPDTISVDSYDYFKDKMKWRFYKQMWEVEPPEPDIWDYFRYLGTAMFAIYIIVFAVFSLIPKFMKEEDVNHD